MQTKHTRSRFFSVMATLLAIVLSLVFQAVPGAGIASAASPVADWAMVAPAAPHNAPALAEINQYLIVGMRPSSAGEAVTIGSSHEIGADRQTLSGDDPTSGSYISPVTPGINPPDPDPFSPDLRDVFFPDPSAPFDTTKNRWIWNASAGSNGPGQNHYLPGAAPLFRGVDWSGDVAVTSATGTFSLQDINVFGQFGFRATNQSAPVNVSNSYYFDDPSLAGVSMDSLDNTLPSPDSPSQGWDGGYNHTQLLADLRSWRDYIRGLPRDAFFNSGDGANPRDLVNRNSINQAGGGLGKFVYDVNALDSNGDGYAVIDIAYDGTDFDVNNSDWIIDDSNLANGTPFVIFRIRGQANMTMSNASIMIGEGVACAGNGLAALFVKVHPEEEFTSTSGSSNAVFNANNLVVNQVGFWDLNTIGDASTDTDYPAPSDPSVYLSGSGGMPGTDYVNRGQQTNYTLFSDNNGQGCSQFISPFVYLQNVRWIKCSQCQADLDYGDAPDTGAGTGVGNYNTVATDNGPSHAIVDNLRLGANDPDADDGTLQNAAATADDLDNTDDEDGVTTLPTVTTASSSVPLSVSVFNNTGSQATLACWIDFNRDGDFSDSGERASATVSSSGSQQSIPLTFSGFAAPTAGSSYLRCRLANAAGQVADPTGAASSGEVEDYQVEILVAEARISISPEADTNEVNEPHTFVVHTEKDGGSGWVDAAGVVVTVTFPGGAPGTVDASDCNAGTHANGTCEVVINSGVAGQFTAHAAADIEVAPGVVLHRETDGTGGNSGDAHKTYILADYEISKTLNNDPTEIIYPRYPVSFTIRISNTGTTWIRVLPMRDVYSTTYLTYGYTDTLGVASFADPDSDDHNNDGVINWSDLTVTLGDLAPAGQPGDSVTVVVTFTAKADTTLLPPDGKTINTAQVHDAWADPDGPGPQGAVIPLPDKEASDGVRIDTPTAVEGVVKASLRATARPDGVWIAWETATEVQILGFNVLRRVSDVAFERVNEEFIWAQYSGADQGAAYALRDEEVASGMTYEYELEVVPLEGDECRHRLGTVDVPWWSWLPLLAR